jgi:tetratricopeptide (TPR) repeat protein
MPTRWTSSRTDEEARAYALEHRSVLLTAQAEEEIQKYHRDSPPELQRRMAQRHTLLHQLRLEMQKPPRWNGVEPATPEPATESRHSANDRDEARLHIPQPLTYDRVQFGNNNVMINNVERVPLNWQRPLEIDLTYLVGAVGRRDELTTLHQKLHEQQQLSILSVHGLPAIGKTTLVALYAHTYAHEYPGGVLWLQYRPDVKDVEQAKVELRRAARWAYQANPEATEILDKRYAVEPDVVRMLLGGHGRLLIIVDNVWKEQVAEVVRQAIPEEAHVLLTTRDTDVAGAFVKHVAKNIYELDVLSEADARLLINTTAPSLPDDVVEKLLHGLDGYAQALVLASSTLARNVDKGVTGQRQDCEEILRRVHVGEGFGHLDQIKSELRDRVKKFEAVLKYSYDRLVDLGQEYQHYFRALGAMAEGASFEAQAFEAVCDIPNGADALRELKQFGLVKTVFEEAGIPARWSQHAILRAYALGLQTPEERLAFPEQHANYVIKMVHACYSGKPRDYTHLEREFAQVIHSYSWCEKEDFQKTLQIVQYCNDFMMVRGRSHLLSVWQLSSISAAQLSGNRLGEANTLKSMGDLANRLGQVDQAQTHYANALTLFRAERAQLGEANTLKSMGDLANRLGQVDQAQTHYANALTLFRAERDQLGEANTLKSMGDLARRLGQLDQAQTHYANALTLYELERDITGKMNVFISIARMNAEQDKLDAAKEYYEKVFSLADSIEFGNNPVTLSLKQEYQALVARSDFSLDHAKVQMIQSLSDLLIQWVKTPDWNASEKFLTEHQDSLLTDVAIQVMEQLIQVNNGNQTLQQYLSILKRAIAEGIEAAYLPLKKPLAE